MTKTRDDINLDAKLDLIADQLEIENKSIRHGEH
jgi:hypothetical protein